MEETFVTRVQTQGRVLIPYHIRRLLNLKENDKIKITVEKVEKHED